MSDELDRLFRALVLRVRDVRPENLSRPFEVGDVMRIFVPYRATRAEVGVETAEDYEVLIVRLLSGERGYMFSDDIMQDDLRRELDSGNPDLRALQAYGAAKVTLAQHAMRQVLEGAPAREPGAASGAASGSAGGAVPAARAPEAPQTVAPQTVAPAAAVEPLHAHLPSPVGDLGEAIGAARDGRGRHSFQAHGSRIPDPTAEATSSAPRPGCRFCGQALPEGREVTFCPQCGQNLKVRRCPGCSEEMDLGWKFCVSCGRVAAG